MVETLGKIAALSWASLFLVACSTPAPEPVVVRQPDPVHGKSIFKAQCASCHEQGRKNAPSIKDAEEWDLQTLKAPGVLARHGTLKGSLGAPRFSALSTSDEVDVLTYIEGQVNEVDPRY